MAVQKIHASDDSRANAFYNQLVKEVVEDFFGRYEEKDFTALILKGAPARHEATVVELEHVPFSLSDMEFIAVVKPEKRADASFSIREWERTINERLQDKSTGVDVIVRTEEQLRTLPHVISVYETAQSPALIWGEPEVLRSLPQFEPCDIPFMDCLTYFHNRIVEQFLVYPSLKEIPDDMKRRLTMLYRTSKLVLDLATAYLYVEGGAPLQYSERVEAFERISSRQKDEKFEHLRPDFLARLKLWVDFKLHGEPEKIYEFYGCDNQAHAFEPLIRKIWFESIAYAEWFWKWFLRKRGFAIKESAKPADLTACYFRLESYPRKVVRWIKTLRHPNVRSRWFSWRRILRLSGKASPRLLVYLSAITAFLSCSETKDSEQYRDIAGRYCPMDLPDDYTTSSAEQQILYVCERLENFYRAVILNRLTGEKGTETKT